MIRYQLDMVDSLFEVDGHTGQLMVSETLGSQHRYHVIITATDHGTPPRSTTASLTVQVGHQPAQKVMTSRLGMSVYVTSAVCVGCFLLASFLLLVAIMRRRRHGNRHHHHHRHERLETSQHETTHVDKSRPLRDLEPSVLLGDFPARRLQVINHHILHICHTYHNRLGVDVGNYRESSTSSQNFVDFGPQTF